MLNPKKDGPKFVAKNSSIGACSFKMYIDLPQYIKFDDDHEHRGHYMRATNADLEPRRLAKSFYGAGISPQCTAWFNHEKRCREAIDKGRIIVAEKKAERKARLEARKAGLPYDSPVASQSPPPSPPSSPLRFTKGSAVKIEKGSESPAKRVRTATFKDSSGSQREVIDLTETEDEYKVLGKASL
jgi:hypothetical protein